MQARRNFPTRNVELKGIDDLYQADLVEMIPYARTNKGYKYIMTVINCFSKFAFAVPLKTKSSDEIVSALEPILSHHKMKHFHTDEGKEWYNSKVRSLLSKHGINHYSTYSAKKASIVERFNRTLKTMMWRRFTEQGHYRWLSLLKELVNEYNGKVHRTIGLRPVDVTSKNEGEVRYNIMAAVRRRPKANTDRFSVGDKVRISKYKKTFDKGYLPNWTNEVFEIERVQPTIPVTYLLKDGRGESLKGGFYAQELSKTRYGDVFLVEKVLRKKGDRLFVRWLGYDKSHDSWIDKKDLI